MAKKKPQRVCPITSTELQRQSNELHALPDEQLHVQELHTTSDELRIFRRHALLGPVDHGTVASADAMVAIWLQPSCTRGVWPGDTCYRSDLGVECRVVSGHHATAAWRPVATAGGGGGDPTAAINEAIAAHDGSGTAHGDLRTLIAGKQATLNNAATLAKVTESGGSPLWNGGDWPGAGGGSASPTTTKGDLIVRGADVDLRLPVGANGEMPVADSTTPTGIRWMGVTSVIPTPATGAVLVSNGTVWQALTGTQAGQVLILDPAGVPTWATVGGISYNPNSGQPQIAGTTLVCDWAFNGDGNGFFYALGTNVRRQAWTSPRTYGPKLAMFYKGGSSQEMFLTNLCDRAANSANYSVSFPFWVCIDLGTTRQGKIRSYSFRQDSTSVSFPRNWSLQGSNNVAAMTTMDIEAANWVDIDVRTADTTISAVSAWGHWAATGDSTTAFRFIRLLISSVATGSASYPIGELEFYGDLTLITQAVPAGSYALTRLTNGDGNGLFYLLGTAGLATAFTNPIASGRVAWISDVVSGASWTVSDLADRVDPTALSSGAWPSATTGSIVFDFGEGRAMAVTEYSVWYSATGYFPRNWKLQGTNVLVGFTLLDAAAANWTDIDVRAASTAINAAGWTTLTPSGGTSTRFRYLRWLNTGANSQGDGTFRPGEFEFYGSLLVG